MCFVLKLNPALLLEHPYWYMYISEYYGCAAGRNVQPIAIKFGTKFSLDVNKNWLVFGDVSLKGVDMVGDIEIIKNS